MAGKSLMVIGGSGFFGKSILDAWCRGLLAPWEIEQIIVVARCASALKLEQPHLLGEHTLLIDLDIRHADFLPSADYVIHAASSSDARRYAEFPQQERANILEAIENYTRLATTAHRRSKIVYTSSGAVYGQQPADLEQITEDYTPRATDEMIAYKRDYAEAKRLAERRLAWLGEQGASVSIARCFAFVGAYLPRDQHFAIGNFIEDGLQGRPIAVQARKPVYRSYMHADDLVCWLMTIAVHGDNNCPIYNVGSDEGFLMGDLARRVAAKFGVKADMPAVEIAETDRYVPSIAKAKKELGLELNYGIDQALDNVCARLKARNNRSLPI